MPTKKRRSREKTREKAQEENRKYFDEVVANAPPHVLSRLHNPPSKLALSLMNTPGKHNAGWAKFDEHGQTIKRADPEGWGANFLRREEKVERALKIRSKYKNTWGKRGAAKAIAHAENLRVETIRRYMRKFPI